MDLRTMKSILYFSNRREEFVAVFRSLKVSARSIALLANVVVILHRTQRIGVNTQRLMGLLHFGNLILAFSLNLALIWLTNILRERI